MHGDRNTSYSIRQQQRRRKKRNSIKRLLDYSGDWKEELNDLNSIILGYFKDLFSSQVRQPDNSVLNKVKRRVTEAMNTTLMAPYTIDEVKKALFSIGDFKAQGPDGLHAVFYKRSWSMVGDDLVEEVLNAVNSCVMPQGWNETTIVMIPKVNSPEKVTRFRPISLCNVVYKVISKLIASRLKLLLPDIIRPTQSAFVPGRLITDNVLISKFACNKAEEEWKRRLVCGET